jgi:hypothetical protein
VTAQSAAGKGLIPRRAKADTLKSWAAIIVALLILAAMLGTVFEKGLVGTLTPQSWSRDLYGVSAGLTKLRFGIGGGVVDLRLFATLQSGGITDDPNPAPGVRYPDNLRDAKLLQSALLRAQTIDLTPPRNIVNANGEYVDLVGFFGDDIGIGTYAWLAFVVFGVSISALTYPYFVIVAVSLLLYGIAHRRSLGAMAAAVAMMVALYVVVCANFVNFLGDGDGYKIPGIDLKDPRFLGSLAALPVLHLIVMAARHTYRLGPLDYAVVAIQAVIFAFALQIRTSVIWAVLALLCLWVVIGAIMLRQHSLRSVLQWRQSHSAFIPITVIAVLLSMRLLAAASLHPLYAAQGDVPRHTFWQGVLSSLQLTPEWDAKYAASVNGAEGDAMPAVMARIAIKKLPPDRQHLYLNSDGATKRTALEKFSRIAFFDIAWNDPRFVLYTFFVAKPQRLLQSEELFFRGLFAGLPLWNALVPGVALLFLVWLVVQSSEARSTLLATAGAVPLFILIAWLPNWLIALSPMVMIDNFVWVVFLLSLCLVLAATAILRPGGGGAKKAAVSGSVAAG